MRLTKEQKFLYSRIAILIASAGWIASASLGIKGSPFWYGGFVFFFWLAFGLVNYSEKNSLWFLVHRRYAFFLFFFALVGSFILVDQFGFTFHLWFYPAYKMWGMLFVYLILFPFTALSLLELFYFLAGVLQERLSFRSGHSSWQHTALDVGESVLFLLMIGACIAGVAGMAILSSAFFVALFWLAFALIKLFFHVERPAHYFAILVFTGLLAILLNEIPNSIAGEWVYLGAPLFNTVLLSVPLFVWLGWYWFVLFTLRLWIFLVLHPKAH